jgi:hypothetical protein
VSPDDIVLKQNNSDKIGPNDLRFSEKLKGSVRWMTRKRNFERIEIARSRAENSKNRLAQLFPLGLSRKFK